MLAAWAGIGGVALLATSYLRQELDASFFAEIEPYSFFSPSQVPIEGGIVQTPEYPESKFYWWDKGEVHDLILFAGTEQPPDVHRMALQVIHMAQQFAVERIYTTAAFISYTHHIQGSKVWGAATDRELLTEMSDYGVISMDQGRIGGLNGSLLATAKEHNISGLCLLGEVPAYALQIAYPKASCAVLDILSRILGIEIDLTKLTAWAEQLQPEVDKLYQALPDHLKEAFAEGSEAEQTSAQPLQAEQPLIADDEFFDEIDRFLQQRPGSEDDEGDEDQELA